MRILYLDLDTLRPDHLGCYGYHRNTSPHIDRIAAQAVRLDNYYCSDAPCLPSRTALTTGRFGIHSGVTGHGGLTADPRPDGRDRNFFGRAGHANLAAFLNRQGLHTCYIGGFGDRHGAWQFYAGFREIHDTGKRGMESAEDVTPTALDWIERNAASENWYLHINYWDPHTPYRAPADFGNPFADDPLPAWLTPEVLERHRAKTGPHSARDLMMFHGRPDPRFPRYPGELNDMDDLRTFMDGYDCGIRYMDDHIGQVLEALARQGVLEDTAIVISGDHGENMGELGIYGEHATADQSTCRVPMIVRWPGCRAGHVDEGLHYNLDWLPTLAELFDAEADPSWEGRSFAATIRAGVGAGREQLVLSQCAHGCQRSVRWGDWLYIRTYHDGYHLFPREMLFNVADDPHEQHDRAAQQPDLRHEGAWRLMNWHDAMMATQPDGHVEDPLWVTLAEGGPFHSRGHLEAYLERLEASGRADGAAALRKRHGAV